MRCADCSKLKKRNRKYYCCRLSDEGEEVVRSMINYNFKCTSFVKKLVEPKVKTTQDKIEELTTAMADLLKDKNKKYGDSALNGVKVFSKVNPTSSICIRLDDKLSRIKNADCLRTNDVCDIMGYLVLLAIEMGMNAEDIAKLKD